jgi:hypothetical protein
MHSCTTQCNVTGPRTINELRQLLSQVVAWKDLKKSCTTQCIVTNPRKIKP